MKKLSLVSLILVGISTLALLYNYFAVQPHLPEIDFMTVPENFDYLTYSAYRHQSDWLGLVGTSLSGIGAILGFVAFFKARTKTGLLSGILGLVIGIATFVVSFAHVN